MVGKGATLFEQRHYQQDVSEAVDKEPLIIGLKARQIGWTTVGVANALYDALFSEEHPWLLVSRTEDAAQKMLNKAVYAYYRLPKWMRDMLPAIRSQTQSEFVFKNGSRIESVPATGSTGRGDSVYGALLDEVGFMEYAEEIWGAVEPLVYGPAMLFSTANGMGNFFHEVWLDSQQKDSVWKGYFYPWDVVPTRNTDWYDHTKASFRGREWLFYQEYPATPEEAFSKSGRVAFGADLTAPCFEEVVPEASYEWIVGEGAVEKDYAKFVDIPIDLWKEPTVIRDEHGRPEWEPNYVVGVDIAEGLEHGDWTYVNVWDVNTHEQVASSKSAIPVSYVDELILWLAEHYHRALIIVEHNNMGILPIDRLYRDHWYPRLYRMDKFAEFRTADRTSRYGWRTDKATKPKMVNDFIYALAEQDILIHDPDFLTESQTFVADGKGSYGATSGNHDDVIMGCLIGWQGLLDSYRYEIIWQDPVLQAPTHDDMDKIWYGDSGTSNADILDRPLGQRGAEKAKKTVIFQPGNFR